MLSRVRGVAQEWKPVGGGGLLSSALAPPTPPSRALPGLQPGGQHRGPHGPQSAPPAPPGSCRTRLGRHEGRPRSWARKGGASTHSASFFFFFLVKKKKKKVVRWARDESQVPAMLFRIAGWGTESTQDEQTRPHPRLLICGWRG